MAIMAFSKINLRRYHLLKKKKRIRGKILAMTQARAKSSETKSVVITLIILTLIFSVIAYFKPS